MLIKKVQVTEDKDVTLTIYIQHPSKEMESVKKKPGILILPGGGYEFCSDREGEPIALSYLKAGYNAFVLEYSLKEKSKFPRPLLDAEAALKMIRDNSEEWSTYKDKIAVIGFSAGGHLASHLGASKVVRPNALILGYGAFIRAEKFGWDYPTVKVDENYPETFLFHTYKDQVVPVDTSIWLAHELSKKKVPFEIHVFRDGQHGLSLGDESVSWGESYQADTHYQNWYNLTIEWLDKVFKDK
jgi:acetyl esterase/lipase